MNVKRKNTNGHDNGKANPMLAQLSSDEIVEVKEYEQQIAAIQTELGRLRTKYLQVENTLLANIGKIQALYEARVSQISIAHGLVAQGWYLDLGAMTISKR